MPARTITCAIAIASCAQASFAQTALEDLSPFQIEEGIRYETPDRDLISPEEQARLNATYPLKKRLRDSDVVIKTRPHRIASGHDVTLVYSHPSGGKASPAVFILDVETAALSEQPVNSYYKLTRRETRRQAHSRYALGSPIGSNLLASGIATAYVTADNLESVRAMRTPDWLSLFEKVRALRAVQDDSFFLFSTSEYANTALYLAGKYSFSGLILEEPEYMLFTPRSYEAIVKNAPRLSSYEIWERANPQLETTYLEYLSRIASPVLLLRNAKSHANAFSEKTLLDSLRHVQTNFEVVKLPSRARYLKHYRQTQGVVDEPPEVLYSRDNLAFCLDQIVGYVQRNSSVSPQPLEAFN